MSLRVVVLTSSRRGTASHHLPMMVGSPHFHCVQVILVNGAAAKPRGHLGRKLRKVMRIGPLGALVGYRMRKWYSADVERLAAIEDLGELCASLSVPFATTPAVNHPRTVELMRDAKADIGISLGNGYIGSKVFTAPRLGMLNIHHEVLPEFQNAQGVIWQLHEGSDSTGYTIHRIDKHIDTGAIVHQQRVPISFQPTLAATVSHTMVALLDASALGLRHVLEDLEAKLAAAKPQGKGRSWTTPSFGQFLRIRRNYVRLRDKVRG
jgi:methionyl-tRNA formyltransferase